MQLNEQMTYRLVDASDTAGLMDLWTQTEWGQPPADLRKWFNANPCPGSFVMVAQDATGLLVGQIIMMAATVFAKDRELSAMFAVAPIIGRTLRDAPRMADPRRHPVVELYQHAVLEAQARGVALIYSMPNVKWLGLFHRLPGIRYATFPLWSATLPLSRLESVGEGYTVSRLIAWDERVDRLWAAASRGYGCAVGRNARVLHWKLALTGLYLVLAVERDDELVGLVAAHTRESGQWTVCDLLAADLEDSLRATLRATCNFGHVYSLMPNLKHPIKKVSILVTPALQEAAVSLGFVRDDYDFLLVVRTLDPTISPDAVAPERWYVSINDHG